MKRIKHAGKFYTVQDVLPSGEYLAMADSGRLVILPAQCEVVA